MDAAPGEGWWKIAHDLACRSGSILLRLRGGYPGLQPPHHIEGPTSLTLLELTLREAHGYPQFTAVQLARNQGKLKVPGHDPDDLVRFAVEENLLSNDASLAMETASPHLVTEHSDRHS